MNLSPALLEEYNTIKRELGAKTATLEAECAALQAATDADAEALRMMHDSSEAVAERIKTLGERDLCMLCSHSLCLDEHTDACFARCA